MKKLIQLFSLGVALFAFPTVMSAQVDVDNQTACDFVVKVNTTMGGLGCPMGAGPAAVVCPAGMVTTIIATPPPMLNVVAYGVHPAGTGATPIIVGRGGCFPGVIATPWCAPLPGAPGATLNYAGNLLIIN